MEAPVLTANSGQRCPASGIWQVMGEITSTQTVSKGDPMPQYCGKKVSWCFLYAC